MEQDKQPNLFNEKRKWQIALRRYIINQNKSVNYAPYFGIDIVGFRNWIEAQFDETLHWDNFSTQWHFEHVLPLVYFNFENNEDLKLCWHFTNIKVEKINQSAITKPNLQATKAYFTTLAGISNLPICKKMIHKIEALDIHSINIHSNQLAFITTQLDNLNAMAQFTSYEFERLNSGDSIKILLAEKALMEKFG